MRSPFATLQSLTIPMGAGPGTPRTVIGGVIPPALAAYYAAAPYSATVVSATLSYDASDNYYYDVALAVAGGSIAMHVLGFVSFAGQVYEELLEFIDFGPESKIWYLGGRQTTVGTSEVAVRSDVDFTYDAISAPRGYRGANSYTKAVAIAGSGGGEAAITAANWNTEPTFTFNPGRAYKWTLTLHLIPSTATDSTALIRVRKGSASVVGTELGVYSVNMSTAAAGQAAGVTLVGFFQNSTAAAVATKLSVTNQRTSGAAAISLYGQANEPLLLVVEDIGLASQQPGLTTAPTV